MANEQHDQHLLEQLQRGQLVLFIGADLPREITGLPSRADLARELARRHRLNESLPLAQVAQQVSATGHRWSYIAFIKDALNTAGKTPQPFHQRIVELVQRHHIKTILSTAYDDLLEWALRQAGVGYTGVVDDNSLAFAGSHQLTLIKLYGDAQRPESLVITHSDHLGLLNDPRRTTLLNKVRSVLFDNTLLFLGYNLADPDFQFLFSQIAANRFARKAYAVWPGLAPVEVDAWRGQGIQILDALPLEILNALLVAPSVSTAGRELVTATRPPSSSTTSFSTSSLLQADKGEGQPAGPQPTLGAGNRWAVLVGVDEYDDQVNYGRLHVCVQDAHAIRERLTAGGFDPARIRLLADDTQDKPTRAKLLAALQSVANATQPDDLLLFYYSGHGDQAGGQSYLVAQDGQHLVLPDTAVPVARVKEIMEQAPARAKVIILDACHSGADIGGKGPKPMSADFIRRVFEEAEGLAILASCKQGELSYEWQAQARSVFTQFMLEALQGQADRDAKGFVTVQDASRHVTDGVKLWASQRNATQTPTLHCTVVGDIILARYQ